MENCCAWLKNQVSIWKDSEIFRKEVACNAFHGLIWHGTVGGFPLLKISLVSLQFVVYAQVYFPVFCNVKL